MEKKRIDARLADLAKELAANLKTWRKRVRFTQQEAADACDVGLRFYQDLESGTKNIELRTLAKVSLATRCDGWNLLHPRGVPLPPRMIIKWKKPEARRSRLRKTT